MNTNLTTTATLTIDIKQGFTIQELLRMLQEIRFHMRMWYLKIRMKVIYIVHHVSRQQ